MHSGYKELLQKVQKDKAYFNDLHIIRFYSSYVAISEGKVIGITTSSMQYCPLAKYLYKNVRFNNHGEVDKMITKAVQEKIGRFGHFTSRRELIKNDIAVPYGASEMLMYAIRRKNVDAAVVVCEGAGTVITEKPEIVQGIGARMNGLFFTTPIPAVINKLEESDCHILSSQAAINQLEGVRKAVSLGYKNIAVTINASTEESFSQLRQIEENNNVSIISLAVCTTSIEEERIRELNEYADLVWSCASSELRETIGSNAILQVSKKIPVFVLTKKGLNFLSAYSSDEKFINDLDLTKQYLVSNDYGSKDINMGRFSVYIKETNLPVRDKKEPKLMNDEKGF